MFFFNSDFLKTCVKKQQKKKKTAENGSLDCFYMPVDIGIGNCNRLFMGLTSN